MNIDHQDLNIYNCGSSSKMKLDHRSPCSIGKASSYRQRGMYHFGQIKPLNNLFEQHKFFLKFWIASNSVVTSLIVGRFLPFKCRHLLARLATTLISVSDTSFIIRASTMSSKRSSCIEVMKYMARLI